jgi:hypothetical protein
LIDYVATGAGMKKTDALFLASVFVTGGMIALLSASQAFRLLPSRGAGEPANAGAAGQARDVDMEKLQRLFRQGRLSQREAEYYRPYRSPDNHDGTTQTKSADPSAGRP